MSAAVFFQLSQLFQRLAGYGGRAPALLLALALGMAWQWQQPRLWPLAVYAGLLAACGAAGLACLLWRRGMALAPEGAAASATFFSATFLSSVLLCLAALGGGFAWPGLRAAWVQRTALPPAWAGQEVDVIGVVAAMPRWQADGVRFRLQPESAQWADAAETPKGPVALVQRLDVAWYGERAPAQSAQAAPAHGESPPSAPIQTKPANPTNPTGQTPNAQPAPRPSAAPIAALQAGDRVRLRLRLRMPAGRLNPGLFDYEQWLWLQGVQATAVVRDGGEAALLGDSGRYRIERWRQRVRDRILARLGGPGAAAQADPLAQRSAAVLAALVTGDQRSIEAGDWEVFRITGVSHLMAISGLHITLFAWLAMGLLNRLWRQWPLAMRLAAAPTAAQWGGLALACAYAVFSGWQLPAQRTIWMLATVVALRTWGVRWPWHATLALAAAVVLVIDPWALQQAGFWLSFVAVAVLLRLAPEPASVAGAQQWAGAWAPARNAGVAMALEESAGAEAAAGQGGSAGTALCPRRLVGLGAWGRELGLGLGRKALALWRLQWRLSLVLMPLTIALFGQVSWVGLLANMVAIPLVTLWVTPLALLAAVVEPLLPLAGWSMQGLLQCLQWMASWPHAASHWPQLPVLWAALGLAGAALAVSRLPPWLRVQGGLWLAAALLWRPSVPAPGQFQVVALDVGQGAAVLVRTHGHSFLYDAGPRYGPGSDAGQSVIVPFLQAQGWRLQGLALSHADSDHIGGAAAVLAYGVDGPVYASFAPGALAHAGAAAADWRLCHAGVAWQWDGVRFAFLAPPAQALQRRLQAAAQAPAAALAASGARNAYSCVLHVQASDGRAALLTGDIGWLQELELRLQYGERLRADWLLAPHHGSRSSSSQAFLQAVQPRHAVAQAGYRNRFGHPHAQVVQRYQAAGVALRSSAQCGAMAWRSQRPEALDCMRQDAPRYWRRGVD
ncbi:DNA internalization-related competence protein ComEC/Rec2 [Allofranklinella schreckenbergeri]|uniref:DNA internalization-related competence protein ComEC/Rec2 n=1 Tax=Allofranklinella schreckenbergeri TaxID=1076744 RepID=A0A3M6R636_9BURK|nr:DNA internalization-related competence protein ComEC/Rec2 [Allofranklinella schreckenbergeri]RMX10310.1 DNA internalization-related competence protein ComEC/Rec2 [Allofranklinella schreckenbergeri]